MPLCCIIAPCGRTSTNGAGRDPGGGGFWRRGASCNSRSSTSLRALSVFCPRRALNVSPAATLSKLWWAAADRAMRTVCCSCFHHERSRRSRLRLAAEATAPSTSMEVNC